MGLNQDKRLMIINDYQPPLANVRVKHILDIARIWVTGHDPETNIALVLLLTLRALRCGLV